MKVEIDENSDGSYSLKAGIEIGVGLGNVEPAAESKFDVELLAPHVSLTELKLNEARYFLRLLKWKLGNEASTHYHFNSFVNALYAFPEVLLREGQGIAGFKEWFAGQKKRLHEDADVERLLDLRNKTTHGGIQPPNLAFGILFREHLDGSRTLEPTLDMIALNEKEVTDPIRIFEKVLSVFESIVAEGVAKGYVTRKAKKGHAMGASFAKEVSPGQWRPARMDEMAMFDPARNKPLRKRGGFRQGVRRRPHSS